MIETLYGKIFEIDALSGVVIIECAGVGYRVTVTANTLSKLPSPAFNAQGERDLSTEKNVRIYTHMAVKEDGVDLYGFHDREELSMFKLLITVSGVGPKAAMSVLSLFTPRALATAISAGDVKSISRAPGVGAKTAARITLELKDKVAKSFPTFDSADNLEPQSIVSPAASHAEKMADARDALTVLGYSRSEVAAAMKNIDSSLPLEEIIKQSLAVLMKN